MCAISKMSGGTWNALTGGIHICSIHNGKEEQFSSVLPFFRSGFENKEKCMYIYDETPPHEIYSEFDHKQSFPEDLHSSRQMEILPYAEAYLPNNGAFDADMVIKNFGRAVDESLAQGYAGLRAVGEMDWVLTSETPWESYIEYERKLNTFYPNKKLAGICQFDANKFSTEFLLDIVLTHPYIILHGKLYQNRYFYTSPMYSNSKTKIPVEDYQTVISTILEDAPLTA